MIDLHLHTTYSDGEYNVRELIDKLNENNIMYASITDHNSIDGIIEYEDKEALYENPNIPDKNKVKSDDMNEIKHSFI